MSVVRRGGGVARCCKVLYGGVVGLWVGWWGVVGMRWCGGVARCWLMVLCCGVGGVPGRGRGGDHFARVRVLLFSARWGSVRVTRTFDTHRHPHVRRTVWVPSLALAIREKCRKTNGVAL